LAGISNPLPPLGTLIAETGLDEAERNLGHYLGLVCQPAGQQA
jgi:hypothetical protein